MRHGCPLLISLLAANYAVAQPAGPTPAALDPPPADARTASASPTDNPNEPPPPTVPTVHTRMVDLDYAVDASALPLLAAELWYTFDRGETWQLYGRDMDLAPPMTFYAAEEGLCGFYFLLTNEAGTSGPPPSRGTEPHAWVLFEPRPLVVQMSAPSFIQDRTGRITAQLRWSVLADDDEDRTARLAFRQLPRGPWRELTDELPDRGAYDWVVPPQVTGEVMFRLTLRGQDGATRAAVTPAVAVPVVQSAPSGPVAAPAASQGGSDALVPRPAPNRRLPSADEMKRARELLRKGRRHQLHGDYELAAARLRDALELDPEMPAALEALGASLYALRDYRASVQAYELALRYDPDDRDALEGLARTLVATRDYDAAEARLLAIVERRPRDVETWLHLGDIAICRGNEIAARRYYHKAATLVPQAASVVSRARARLEELPSLHRRRTATP